ncbi:MAG: hypothetical protein MRY83_14375 [Flavobacteriales bacterium]|nr:hypothetical protein [Flavobacteriales bacterium]
MIYKFVHITLILALFGLNVFGQNPSTEELKIVFDKMTEFYSNTDNYSTDIVHKSYKKQTDSEPHERSKGKFYKIGDDYFSDLLGYKTLQKGSIRLTVNDREKVMAISEPHSFDPKDFMNTDVEKWLEVCESVSSEKTSSGEKYVFKYKKGPYSQCELTVHNKGWLQKVTIYFNKTIKNDQNESVRIEPKLEILYENFVIGKVKSEQINLDRYITSQGKKYKPHATFSDYKILDTRLK